MNPIRRKRNPKGQSSVERAKARTGNAGTSHPACPQHYNRWKTVRSRATAPITSGALPARRCRTAHVETITLTGPLPVELENHLFGLSDQEFASLMRGEAVRTPARGVTVRLSSDKQGECTVVLSFTSESWQRLRHLECALQRARCKRGAQ